MPRTNAYQPRLQIQAVAQNTHSEETAVLDQIESVNLQNVFADAQAETATFRSENAVRMASEFIPPLSDDGLSCLSWWQKTTSLRELRNLLDKARHPTECKRITQTDLRTVIQYCDYQGYLIFSDRRKLAKTAIRILSYLAQHQRLLPNEAITALKKELWYQEGTNEKIIHYAVLGISYVIHNQNINTNDIETSLIKAVNKLKERNREEDRETIMTALSALTKMGYQLSANDFHWIKNQLMDVPASNLPVQNLRPYFANEKGLAFWRTGYSELVLMKQISKRKELLSEDQLLFAERYWRETTDIKSKVKILHIMRYSVANGQILTNINPCLDILSKALGDDERKIRYSAIITLNTLLEAGFLEDNYPSLKEALKSAESHYRFYAVKALIYYCENSESNLENLKTVWNEWTTVLSNEQGNERLKGCVRHLQWLLSDERLTVDTDILAEVDSLLEERRATEASVMIFNLSKKDDLTFISQLFGQIKELLKQDQPLEAKLNTLLALKNIREKGLPIPPDIIESAAAIIPNCFTALSNAVLDFFGVCSLEELRHITKKLYKGLLPLINDRETAHNANALLTKLMESETINTAYQDKTSELIYKAVHFLSDSAPDDVVQKNISVAFLKASKLHPYLIDQSILERLPDAIKASDEPTKKRFLLSIGYIIEGNSDIEFPIALIHFLIDELGHSSEEERKLAVYILCMYIEKAITALDDHAIDRIADHFIRKDLFFSTYQVLKTISQTTGKLSNHALVIVADKLKDSLVGIQIAAANLLSQSTGIAFPLEVTEKMEDVLTTNFSQEVIALIIKTFKLLCESQKYGSIISDNADNLLYFLANIAKNSAYYGIETKLNALTVLYHFSLNKKRLNFEILSDLLPLLTSPNRSLRQRAGELFEWQTDYFILSIRNNNNSVYEILDGIQNRIQDNNILLNILEILRKAQENNYLIAEENIPKLIQFMRYHNNTSVRSTAFSILKNYSGLSEETKQIVQLADSGFILSSIYRTTDEKNAALEFILNAVGNKIMLASADFYAIEQLINTEPSFKDRALNICLLSVRNGQKLPQSLLNILNQMLLGNEQEESITATAGLIISETTVHHGVYISQETYTNIEVLFIRTSVTLDDSAYLSLMEIAIKRGFSLNDECLPKVRACLLYEDLSVCRAAARVLACFPKEISPEFVKTITDLLQKIKDSNTQQEISRFLGNQLSSVSVDNDTIESLVEILERGNNLFSERQAFAILARQREHRIMPIRAAKLLAIKKREFILLQDDIDNKSKIDIIEYLVKKEYRFLERDFLKIESIIRTLLNQEINNSHELLNKLLNFFPKIIFNDFKCSDSFFEIIINIVSSYPYPDVRSSAHRVLEHYDYENILNLESRLDNDSIDQTINRIIQKHEEGKDIAFNEIEFICRFLESIFTVFSYGIFEILLSEKEKILPDYYRGLLEFILRIEDLIPDFHEKKAIDLCCYILKQNVFSEEDLVHLLSEIKNQFSSGKITSLSLKIAEYCIIQSSSFKVGKIIKYLLKCFSDVNDSKLKSQILETLINFIYGNDKVKNIDFRKFLDNLTKVVKSESDKDSANKLIACVFFHSRKKNFNQNGRIIGYIENQFSSHFPENQNCQDIGFKLVCLLVKPNHFPEFLENTEQNLYVRELFRYYLLEFIRYDEDFDAQRRIFNHRIDELYRKFHSNLDGFLFLIKIKQYKENLSLNEINNILFILASSESRISFEVLEKQLIFYSLEENKSRWINEILKNHHLNNAEIKKITKEFHQLNLGCELLDSLLWLFTEKPDVKEFLDFLIVLNQYKASEKQLKTIFEASKITSIAELRDIFYQKQIGEQIDKIISVETDEKTDKFRAVELKQLLKNLLCKGWNFDNLFNLLTRLSKNNLEDIISLFEYPFLYCIEESIFYSYCEIDPLDPLDRLLRTLHEECVNLHFYSSKEKERIELLDEMKADLDNAYNAALSDLLNNDVLLSIMQESSLLFHQTSSLPSGFNSYRQNTISQWSKVDILRWSQHIQSISNQAVSDPNNFISEILAVIRRACLLHSQSEIEPRDTQVLAVLCLLYRPEDKGRFAQIITGEGKSLITAMLAVILILTKKNKTIDAITSSPILAIEGEKVYRGFYALFGLNSASNMEQMDARGAKSCYEEKIHIVYSDERNFLFDILRHEYSKLGTRGKRGFDGVIFDEVDNLLIDKIRDIAMLSSSTPGMNTLLPILGTLWQELLSVVLNLIISPASPRKEITEYMRKIVDGKLNELIEIPLHLKEFARNQSERWIDSIILAYEVFSENHHYSIELNDLNQESIVPVDCTNTGTLQKGSSLTDGLELVLQFRHGLQVSPETLTTNFLSNVALADRYGENIYGITGTLGSKESRQLLADMYSVDFVNVPTYKEKRFFELPGELIADDAHWRLKIINRAIREAKRGRVILIVCESIADACYFTHRVEILYKEGKVFEYSKGDEEQKQFLKEPVDCGTIIIGTNLASRGIDIRMTPDAIKQGALHVLCTFLPGNKRVEDQIFGRASRKGEPGSGELILLSSQKHSIKTSKLLRDNEEKVVIENIRRTEFPITRKKDRLFAHYQELIETLNEIDNNHTIYENMLETWGLPHSLAQELMQEMIPYKRAGLEEQWGFWLKERHLDTLDEGEANNIESDFDEFKEEIIQAYQENTIIKNPIYWVRLGNSFINKSNSWKHFFKKTAFQNDLKLATIFYNKAITADPNYAFIAYYNQVYAIINLAEGAYKNEAKQCLIKVKNIVPDKIARTQALSNIVENIKNISNKLSEEYYRNDLSEQILNDAQVLNILANSAHLGLDSIERSQNLINIKFSESQNATYKLFNKLTQEECLSVIEQENDYQSITVTLARLKKGKDLGDDFSLFGIIKKFKEIVHRDLRINIIFDGKNLQFHGNLSHTLKSLLPINRKATHEKSKSGNSEESKQGEPKRNTLLEKASNAASNAASYVGKKAIQTVNTVSDTINNGIDTYKRYKEAENLLVSIEINGLALSQAKSFLTEKAEENTHIEVKAGEEKAEENTNFGVEVSEGKSEENTSVEVKANVEVKASEEKAHFTLVINNPRKKILSVIKETSELQEALKVFVKNFDNGFITINLQDIELIENFHENTELHYSSPSKETLWNVLNLLENKIKQLSQEEQYLHLADTDLVFESIPQHEANCILSSPIPFYKAKLSFCGLREREIRPVIELTETQYTNANFEIPRLDKGSAASLIQCAKRKDEDFNVQLKPVEVEFLRINSRPSWIDEYKTNGYDFLYDLKERNPMPWKAISAIAVFGTLQIVGGLMLMAVSSGSLANFALGLVTEGVADILRAGTMCYTREFNANSYLIQKAISITISLATAGWAASSAASTTSTTTQSVANMSDEAASLAYGVYGYTTLGKRMVIAAKQAAIGAGKKIGTTLTRSGFSSLGKKAIESAKPYMDGRAREVLEREFLTAEWESIMNKVFATDCFIYSGSRGHYEEKLRLAIRKSINDITFSVPDIELFGLSSANQFHENLEKEITELRMELEQFNVILYKRLLSVERMSISQNDVDNICKQLRRNKILSSTNRINTEEIKNYVIPSAEQKETSFLYHEVSYDFSRLDLKTPYKEQVLKACLSYCAVTEEKYGLKMRQLRNDMAAELTHIFQSSANAGAKFASSILAGAVNVGLNHAAHHANESGIHHGDAHGHHDTHASIDEHDFSHHHTHPGETTIDSEIHHVNSQMEHLEPDLESHIESIVENHGDSEHLHVPHQEGFHPIRDIHGHHHNADHFHSDHHIDHPHSEPFHHLHEDHLHHVHPDKSLNEICHDHEHCHLHYKTHSLILGKPHHDQKVSDAQSITGSSCSPDHHSIFLDDNAAEEIVHTIRDGCLEFYKQKLTKKLKREVLLMASTIGGASHESWSTLNSILIEGEKIIKIWVAVIIAWQMSDDLEYSINPEEEFNKEEEVENAKSRIETTAEEIAELIFQNPLKGLEIIKQYTGINLDTVDPDIININELNETLDNYYQLKLKKGNYMPSHQELINRLSSLDINAGLERFMHYVECRNYSECGNLLREGHLGSSGYIASTFLNSWFAIQQASTAGSHKVKCMMMVLASQAQKNEAEFMQMVSASNARREKLVASVIRMMEVNSEKNHSERREVLGMLVEGKITETAYFRFLEHIEKVSATDERISAHLTEICRANAVEPDMVKQCHQIHLKVITAITDTIKHIVGKDESQLRAFFEQTRGLVADFRGVAAPVTEETKEETHAEEKAAVNGISRHGVFANPTARSEEKPITPDAPDAKAGNDEEAAGQEGREVPDVTLR